MQQLYTCAVCGRPHAYPAASVVSAEEAGSCACTTLSILPGHLLTCSRLLYAVSPTNAGTQQPLTSQPMRLKSTPDTTYTLPFSQPGLSGQRGSSAPQPGQSPGQTLPRRPCTLTCSTHSTMPWAARPHLLSGPRP